MSDDKKPVVAASAVATASTSTSEQLELPMARAKALPIQGSPPELAPARMVNEVLYCERLAYLEWAQKEFVDNFFTVEGRTVAHRRVDERAQAPAAPDADRPWQARSVWLSSTALGLTAKIDIVEAANDGSVAPVEYKRGSKPKVAGGAWLPERAQLCAQVLLLREHGYRCNEAWIWYAGGREKVAITIDKALIADTLAAIKRLREVTSTAQLPPPLDNDPKCRGCSLSGLCLPDELNFLTRQTKQSSTQEPPPIGVRRLHAANDDRSPLYVQEQGASVGVRKQRLHVRSRDGSEVEVRIPNTSQVCLLGNVQISTQAMRVLLTEGIPVAFFTTGHWYVGRTLTHDTNNVELRMAQYRAYTDEPWRLKLATALVHNKILNQRTLLRRNHDNVSPTTLFELKQLAQKATEAGARPSLLGLEGTAARSYFGAFTGMLKGNAALGGAFNLEGRNRRPPRDPINALLSLAYSLLAKDWSITLQLVGLDPLLGFYHEPRFGRPALALDLMEPFRPIIADSVVIGLINNGELSAGDFITSTTGCMLTHSARRKLIAAYERRMAHEITHPVFDYRISYRRTLEVQARLLARHLLGEIAAYPEFRTR